MIVKQEYGFAPEARGVAQKALSLHMLKAQHLSEGAYIEMICRQCMYGLTVLVLMQALTNF